VDFSLTPEQVDLQDSVRRLMQTAASDDILIGIQGAPTGFLPDVWSQVSQAGWLSLVIPEQYGGAGAQLADAAIVLEQFGTGPLPLLFAVAAALSPLLIAETGTDAQKQAWLPRLAEGNERVTVALTEPDFGWEPAQVHATLAAKGPEFVLSGTKAFVPDLAGSTRVLVTARVGDTGRIALVIVDTAAPGVRHEPIEGFVSWQSVLYLDDVTVAPDDVLGSADTDAWAAIQSAIESAIPLINSYQVGSCQSVFEMSLRHTRNRVQFGQPIGRFQRVQDHLIELTNYLDAARWTTYETIWKVDSGLPARAGIHLSKSVVAEAHFEVCNYAHEIHAGLGADMQYGLAKHTYLSRSLYHFLGEPRLHREQMARALEW
jgi:alkylation response protein AidB-like acyl-CoA dehydrogenase